MNNWASATSWCHLQGAWVTEKLLRPRPVTADLFAERIAGVNAAAGAAIVRALSGAGLLNATSFLLEDPRSHPLTLRSQDRRKEGFRGAGYNLPAGPAAILQHLQAHCWTPAHPT